MKIGLLSDAHGNGVALEACLNVLARLGTNELYFLGDAVGYIPGEVECIQLLTDAGAQCQQGNHEVMLLRPLVVPTHDDVYGVVAARHRIPPAMLASIQEWPLYREVDIDGRRLLMVHASPRHPTTEYVYPDSDLRVHVDSRFDAIFMGHTHWPFVRRLDDTLMVNVGSVGLPRDVGHLATVAVYDTKDQDCSLHRVPFDVGLVLRRWGSSMHDATVSCLGRRRESFEGELVGEPWSQP